MRRRLFALVLGGVLCAADAAYGQDRPTVFLHGFGAEAKDWAATADRLKETIALQPHIPSLKWRDMFEDQSKNLQATAEYANLPADTVAVGHSNGGLVAREWSKAHALSGLVTLGSPHQGAPILARLLNWRDFAASAPAFLNLAVDSFSTQSDWTWIYAEVEAFLKWVSSFSIWSVVNLFTTLGVDLAMPVANEMIPQSKYLTQLNSAENLAREASAVPSRVGIASIAHNYFYAGPARAIAPEYADTIATAMYASAFGLMAWADYIFFEASPTDVAAFQQMTSLLNVAGFIFSIDPTYCRYVSRWDASDCVPNDGMVPIDSQAYPGAPNILIGTENDGPAHKQEKQWGDDALYLALTTFAHVPARGSTVTPAPAPTPTPAPAPAPEPAPAPAPPPAPAPEPEPAPSPTPDPEPEPWPEPEPDPEPAPEEAPRGPVEITSGVLFANEYLFPGDTLSSTEGNRHLSYQGDGNLVIYDQNWVPLWASDTGGTRAGVVAMQGDGNLVIYDPDGAPIWATNTGAWPGAYLAVQNDGNVVIYDQNGSPLWTTDTF